MRRAFRAGLQNPFDHHARPQVAADQLQQSLVTHLAGDATHQDVVLDPVKELRQVHVHDEAAASADRPLHLLGCSMGGAVRSKTVARIREARIEHRRQNLLDGLLNQTVQHVWNAELPLTAIRFINGLPANRRRLIGPIEKLLPAVIRRAKTGHSSAPKTGHHVGVLGGRIVLFDPVGKGCDQVVAV